MKLAVAANYDAAIAPELARWPVEEVYGKLPADGISGGRPSYMGSPIGWDGLARYAAALRQRGIAFNYLLNGVCMGNREWTASWQKRVVRVLERLGAMGIDRVTVSTPYLLELIKARLPQFRVKVGIYAGVDTPERARFWEDLGADAINVDSLALNRDFERLSAIRAAVRCPLPLIANHICLRDCPLQRYHQVGMAHASDGSGGLFVDWCFLRCSRLRLEDPSHMIRSPWIRPEDVHVYESMGFDTLKLLERGIPSEELLKRVRAYGERRFEGNLAELLLPYGFRKAPRKERFWALRHFLRPRAMRPWRARPLLDLARRQGMLFALDEPLVHIDSAAIPADFLEGFRTAPCAGGACTDCGRCRRIADAAVRLNASAREELLQGYRAAERAMATGELWSV